MSEERADSESVSPGPDAPALVWYNWAVRRQAAGAFTEAHAGTARRSA